MGYNDNIYLYSAKSIIAHVGRFTMSNSKKEY